MGATRWSPDKKMAQRYIMNQRREKQRGVLFFSISALCPVMRGLVREAEEGWKEGGKRGE